MFMNSQLFRGIAVLPVLAICLSSCATSKGKKSSVHHGSSVSHQAREEDSRESGEILSGRFVVTATSGTTVVYRPLDGEQERSKVRIVVNYASGLLLPEKGTVIERQRQRGFKVFNVSTAEDGNRNFFAHDLTAP
jgi:hypothetical protein